MIKGIELSKERVVLSVNKFETLYNLANSSFIGDLTDTCEEGKALKDLINYAYSRICELGWDPQTRFELIEKTDNYESFLHSIVIQCSEDDDWYSCKYEMYMIVEYCTLPSVSVYNPDIRRYGKPFKYEKMKLDEFLLNSILFYDKSKQEVAI